MLLRIYHVVEGIKRLLKTHALRGTPYGHLNGYRKRTPKRILQMMRRKMLKTVNKKERTYEMTLSHEKDSWKEATEI